MEEESYPGPNNILMAMIMEITVAMVMVMMLGLMMLGLMMLALMMLALMMLALMMLATMTMMMAMEGVSIEEARMDDPVGMRSPDEDGKCLWW